MRKLWLVLATASALACVSCRGDSPVAPVAPATVEPALAGAYGLASLNGGAPPPGVGSDGIGAIELLSGCIKLNSDGSYLDILTLRRRGPSGIQIEVDTIRG